MGNCSCLERARVTAWDDDDDDDDDWGLPAVRSGAARGVVSAGNGSGGMRVKIRLTKGQLRRLLETAGRGGASEEDVVAEIMRMSTVRVDVAELRLRQAAERHRPPMLETIHEDDVDE